MRRDRVERLGVLIGDETRPHLAAEQKIEARPRNWVTPVALVLLHEESSYGYELMERLEDFGFEEIRAQTLYRILRQMENEGLCNSELEPPGVLRPAERTQLLRMGNLILFGRRRVSSTRLLWTLSTEPIQVGSPGLRSTAKSSPRYARGRSGGGCGERAPRGDSATRGDGRGTTQSRVGAR